MRRDFVFAYGSLLSPRSLQSTLPDIEVASCVPARAEGYVRTWSVAFPNDGTQPDKSYRAKDETRPGVVVFVNLEQASGEPAAGAGANGVLIPLGFDRIERLVRRERRYRTEDVSSSIAVYRGFEDLVYGAEMHVETFVGRPDFVRDQDLNRGVIGREYKETIERGVAYWNQRVSGFRSDYELSTVLRPELPVVDLERIDHT